MVKRANFVEFMVGRGFEAEWCEAAFTTFDSHKRGGLNQFQFLLSVSALTYNRGSPETGVNPRWLAMRQLILYNLLLRCYGSQNSEGVESQGVSCDSFMDFLQVLSGTDESPTYFGIDNDKWSRFARSEGDRYNSDSSIGYLGEDNRSVEGAKMRTTLDIIDQSTLAGESSHFEGSVGE